VVPSERLERDPALGETALDVSAPHVVRDGREELVERLPAETVAVSG